MIRTEEEQKEARKIFDPYRDDLLRRQLSNSENYDKAILSLSSAGLALSLTALKFVIPLETANIIWAVVFAWVLFFLTISGSIIAFVIGNKAIEEQLKNTEDFYIKGIESAFDRKNIWSERNDFINRFVGVTFIVAILLVVIFVSFNITYKGNEMSKKTRNTNPQVLSKKSANVPRMPPTNATTSNNSANVPSMPVPTTASGGSGATSKGGNDSSGGEK